MMSPFVIHAASNSVWGEEAGMGLPAHRWLAQSCPPPPSAETWLTVFCPSLFTEQINTIPAIGILLFGVSLTGVEKAFSHW